MSNSKPLQCAECTLTFESAEALKEHISHNECLPLEIMKDLGILTSEKSEESKAFLKEKSIICFLIQVYK